jgi:hypothetical protein
LGRRARPDLRPLVELALRALRHRDLGRGDREPLRRFDRLRRPVREAPRDGERLGLGLAGRDDAADDAHRAGLLAGDAAAREQQVAGNALTDRADQALRPTAAGDQADGRLRECEQRGRAGDADVACERELEAAAQARAVDRGDRRAVHALKR